ncbi:cyclic peptide export ABC transporter [Motilimonas pumila]|uniref:Cyclic peptide export ABC transporter n=1 Tax=Motilimonas pumila TaxID=2303987 RepID=A0A418Y9L2_9GAMM|nr:cyclic peptide export ABC transporter [Motilimonas pumila]RJG37753.1 cyclic peptide export ABC transporter [Motilimonas pumila]
MALLRLFTKHAPNKVFYAVLAGAFSGICYALLIPVIMSALSLTPDGLSLQNEQTQQFLGFEVAHPKFAALFLILCIIILLLRTTSQVLLARVGLDVTSQLRQNLYQQISKTSIPYLEKSSSGKLIQSMTTDVQRIVYGAGLIPDLLIQFSTLLGLMGFLLYLNSKLFVLLVAILVFGIVTFQIPMLFGSRYFTRSRDHMDLLQEGFKGLVEGAKELKLNRSKHKHFLDNQLLKQERLVIGHEKMGFTIVQMARNYGDLICFFTMGIIGFIYINYHAISVSELTGVIMVLLYITAPVSFILNVLPELAIARISLNKVEALFDELPAEEVEISLSPVAEWQTLHLKGISYQHLTSEPGAKSFGVEQVDACIRRGEVSFIVGGNGSGKSTFSKVLSLHYPASSGEIWFDDVLVTGENINSYRQQIACIYSDYYLFKQLHKDYSHTPDITQQINHYLAALLLQDKVEFSEGHFSTLALSDGQRRRLALLVAFLDDKALYVFDEWAADQDPHFKHVFYHEILPNLKSQGKAVVAISHDDRYFELADQIIMLEDGKLKKVNTASL